MSPTPKRLYAHRGARGRAPENTMIAFGAAMEDGANALEMDVQRTKDGEVIVFHDDDGMRMAGISARVDESSFAEVQRWDVGRGFVPAVGEPVPAALGGEEPRPFAGRGLAPPRFADVLRAFPGVPINVDLKSRDPRLVDAVVRIVDEADATARVLLTSFWDDVIDRVQATGTRCATGLARNGVRALRFLPLVVVRRALRRHVARGGTRVQVPPRVTGVSLATPDFLRRCHDLGFAVDYWVVNDVTQGQALFARGADGLMTDFPRRLAPLIASARSSVA